MKLKFHLRLSPPGLPGGPSAIRMLLMRIYFIITLLTTTCIYASARIGFAQNVTLHGQQLALNQILKQISEQSGYNFFGDMQLLKKASPVSISVTNADLREVLEHCFANQPFTYSLSRHDKAIVIREKSSRRNRKDRPEILNSQAEVRGSVTDSAGTPLTGASVRVKGLSQSTMTDDRGAFVLPNVPNGALLVISFVGYQTREIPATGGPMQIVLNELKNQLDDIVVVGYGTVKKSSVTAAISKVENINLDQIPAGRPESALVGRIAGVNIAQSRARPGASPSITVRGPGSISASNNPLIVIDGFPGGSFDNINMNDVQSLEVLKDASSAAIYGSRGSGGVIIITTKSGQEGKPKLNVNSYVGIATALRHGNDAWIPGGQEFYEYTARYINRDYGWIGGDTSLPLWGDERRPAQYRVNPIIAEGNHNWEEILLQPAPVQNYSLSVSGARNNANYYISANVKDEQGTLRETGYHQYALRANVKLDITPGISAGLMISPNYSKQRLPLAGFQNLVKMPPFLSPEKNPDGTYPRPRDYWGTTVSAGPGPLATLEGTHYYTERFNNVGEAFAKATLLPGLDLRSSFGFNVSYTTVENFQEASATSNDRNTGYSWDDRFFNLINENVLSYSTTVGKHDIASVLGASFQYNLERRSRMVAEPGSFANETIHTLNNAIITPNGTYTRKSHWGLASYFARINYGYDSKYLLSASIRTDGSSRFGPNTRWGYFPSASAAWRISQEPFMQDIEAINELKLRASYGSVGNFEIDDFQYLGLIGNAVYSPNGQIFQGRAQSAFGNPDLRWEKTNSYDIGLELGLFNNRIALVADYYHKNTKDLLYMVSIPSISGFTTAISNVGDIVNKGVELELTTKNFTGGFKWQTSFNFAKNRNEVTSLGGGVNEVINTHSREMSWILRVGEPMFSYYGYRSAGVLQTQADMQSYPVKPGQRIGTVRYDDINGDGEITPADRTILGNYMPNILMGMVNDFSYKNFDLSIALQSSLGGKMYNLENLYYQGATVSAFLRPIVENQWWSEEEPGDGKQPATSLAALNFVSDTDHYIENASFLAIRNVNLGYTFPARLLERMGNINTLRLYLSVSNLHIFTSKDFNGYNPEGFTNAEQGTAFKPGHNDGSEPIPRIVALGLNVNF